MSEAQLEYAARDAAVLLPLREKLIERLKSESLVKVAQLEFECVMTVVDIELAGFFMHKDRWLDQLAIVEKRRTELAEQLQQVLAEESSQGSLFGGPQRDDINLDSHQQLTQALNRLGIPVPDSTTQLEDATAGRAVSGHRNVARIPHGAKGADELRREHDRVDQSGDEASARRLSSDWRTDGKIRVHESKHSTGAACGRIPTLFQWLIRKDESWSSPTIRRSSCEFLRSFPAIKGFIDAFNSGADLHRVTAAQVFNASLDQVTKEQRDFAKRLNFGVVYGIGAQRFALMTGLSVSDAENVLRALLWHLSTT